MAIQLIKLRYVPEDELLELYALLDEHKVDYYETSAGNWGISMPALWLRDETQYPWVKALLDDYQRERCARARAEYQALKESGGARSFRDIIRENPFRFVLYMALVLGLIGLSILPFVSLLGNPGSDGF